MTTRRYITFLSVALLVVLLVALMPAAYADDWGQPCRYGEPAGFCGGKSYGDCGAYGSCGWSEAARKDVLSQFLACVMMAECESDPVLRESLWQSADQLWSLYREMAFLPSEAVCPWGEYWPDTWEPDPYLDDWDETDGTEGEIPAGIEPEAGAAEITAGEPVEGDSRSDDPYLTNDVPGDNVEQTDTEQPSAMPAEEAPTADSQGKTVTEETTSEQPLFGIPNPWTETALLEEAITISSVQVVLPAEELLPQKMTFSAYRAVPGTIEADYNNGEEKLMIRASLDDEGYNLSGDYNTYSTLWIENISGVTVDCLGDGERVNVATFKNGDVAYAITMACGREGSGLTVSELKTLVEAMLCTPADSELSEGADAYAAAGVPADQAVVTDTAVLLTTLDPVQVDQDGLPVRMVRRSETNLGDFIADAYRVQGGADIGLVNSGGLCGEFGKGIVTYQDLYDCSPYGDSLCVAEVSGQQILDTLEWACRMLPDETGSFLQVSGLRFEVRTDLPSPCLADVNSRFAGILGERRVKNVLVGDEPLDPNGIYTVAASDYVLLSGEDGNTAFRGAKLLKDRVTPDTQLLIDYLIDDCDGVIGEEYADPYGQGRIVIVASAEKEAEPEAQPEAEPEPETIGEIEQDSETKGETTAESHYKSKSFYSKGGRFKVGNNPKSAFGYSFPYSS